MRNFINLSNHSSKMWSDEQSSAALQILDVCNDASDKKIVDVAFPIIDPEASQLDVFELVKHKFEECRDVCMGTMKPENTIIHVVGEPCFVFSFVKYAIDKGYRCCAATTKRESVETVNADGSVTKTNVFKFVQFRPY